MLTQLSELVDGLAEVTCDILSQKMAVRIDVYSDEELKDYCPLHLQWNILVNVGLSRASIPHNGI